MSLLPLLRPGMREWPQRSDLREWLESNARFREDVLARLRAEGPLLASEIPDTAQVPLPPSAWSRASQVPHLLEFLARRGEVAVSGRRGRYRLWDLAERVYPADASEHDGLGTDEAARLLDERRLQAAGIARQKSPWTRVGEAGEAAVVEGSRWKWRVDPEAVAALDDDRGGRVAFLNPYDAMLFDRPRLKELFEFEYVLEQFKPKAQRRYGFFAHPILLGDRFVGLLDAEIDREREALRVNAVHELIEFDEDETEMVRAEIEALGEWLGMPVVGLT